ncbi:plasmid fertility inhibition factor family protein [Pseudomonas syringae]|uniref:plasmid fertility inhibition factor family protein n=1 Tax=Pseudomonas syringae TaxID=317 RepID=UPI003CC7A0E3
MLYDDELFQVKLDDHHPEYQYVTFKRSSGHENYEVVEVDTEKLIYYSDQDLEGYVLAPVEQWRKDKREGIFKFLAPPGPRERIPEMPVICFRVRKTVRCVRKWFLFKKYIVSNQRYIGYTNGRHRARYLHYAGAKRIPVMCHVTEVSALRTYCSNQRNNS